jgi:hypothetical protein
MKSKEDVSAYVIMYAVKNKKGDVIALLLKNGVVVPSNSNDMQVALVVTEMLKKSKSFEKDFTKLVQSQEMVSALTSNMAGMYSNMSGYNNAQGFVYEPIDFGTTIFKTTPATTSISQVSANEPKISEDKISGFEKYLLLGQGLFSDFTKMKENEAKVKLANASVELEKLNKLPSAETKKSSNAIYIVLGLVGVGLLGFLTYRMVKKQ